MNRLPTEFFMNGDLWTALAGLSVAAFHATAPVAVAYLSGNRLGRGMGFFMVGGELGRRIRDMGLVPGTEIKVQGRAPLKDPVALRVMGATLTLRNNEADYIEVEVD